jgi:hypothetical protein
MNRKRKRTGKTETRTIRFVDHEGKILRTGTIKVTSFVKKIVAPYYVPNKEK